MRSFSSILKFVLPLMFGVGILYLAFRNLDFPLFLDKLRETNYWWVIGSMVLSIFAYVSRAYRWGILLSPMGYNISLYRLTIAVFVNYLANMALPRIGEVMRGAVIKRTDNVPLAKSVGAVVTERIIDSLMLLALLGLTLVLSFDLISSYFNQIFSTYAINLDGLILTGIVSATSGVVLAIYLWKSNGKIAVKIRMIWKDLLEGMLAVREVKNIWGFVLSTLIMWIAYYLMSYMIVFALEETSFLSMSAGFMLLVTGGIAMALPVQGGIGTYHAMVAMMLMLYGVEETTSLFLATLLHTSQVVAIAIYGGISVVLTLMIQRNNEAIKE